MSENKDNELAALEAKLDQLSARLRDEPLKFEISDMELFLLVEVAEIGIAYLTRADCPPGRELEADEFLRQKLEDLTENAAPASPIRVAAIVRALMENRFYPMLDEGDVK